MHPDELTDLGAVLDNRRWWDRARPYRHVVARDVLRAVHYDEVVDGFRDLFAGPSGYLERHDIHGRTLTPGYDGPLRLFASRPWRDLLAELFGVDATVHMNCGVHRHEAGGRNGFVHNDLNPGWFAGDEDDYGIQLSDPRRCEYRTGELLEPGSAAAVTGTIRAVAAIFYLDNPPWSPGDGGSTGLYRNLEDPLERPAASVPPVNNSMLAFECTPWSFHGFIRNRANVRNSVIMWLHRPRRDVVARWGEEAIVDYAR